MRPRQFRRLMRAGGLLGLRPRRLLNQAHGLQAVGQFKEAAQIFGDLSDQVANLAMPDRAGNLSLQAANALFEAGDVQPALARAQRGLTLLVQAGREWRAGVALQNMSAALRARLQRRSRRARKAVPRTARRRWRTASRAPAARAPAAQVPELRRADAFRRNRLDRRHDGRVPVLRDARARGVTAQVNMQGFSVDS